MPEHRFSLTVHCVKSVQIQSFFWSVFSFIRIFLIYYINLRIQSAYRKIRTRKNSISGLFSRSGIFLCNYRIFDFVLLRESRGQRKSVFWHIILSDKNFVNRIIIAKLRSVSFKLAVVTGKWVPLEHQTFYSLMKRGK